MPNMIKLPILFESVLSKDVGLSAAVNQSFELFEPWLTQSGMPFFPGFTDHSPRHITDVLNTSASLISDNSYELLTADDVATLCIATLLHDCGMHLTQDGFRALIEDSTPSPISGFNDRPWKQLWTEYLAEARRFGQDKLLAIFGETEPIRTDAIDYDNLSERDLLLIGEFVRRHHTRLAHEIALKGVPSRSANKLELKGFNSDLKDLAGLVARSHGMPIRSTFSYLEEKYSLVPDQCRVKSPFLMAVLRISDYVQVQSERALKSLLSVKELRSPLSKQEWRNHFAVKNVSRWHNDPEAFFVNAAPTDVKTFLRLTNLFSDIQRELDESWATLGEVYGRLGSLAGLGLTMRRIRSNLDSVEKFAKTVPYVPIKANFDSSGPELLKLLVGPLYDYEYKIGIRELIQNAVDACREFVDSKGETTSKTQSPVAVPDVVIGIEENDDGTGWVTVTDCGVGMTLDTVTKYYLIAGASFRNSDLWKQQHLDEGGQARITRGGRFGVGALAAFLLGDEIEVKTRHFGRPDQDGIEFRARIDDPAIELRRCIAPVGTTIKVWISNPRVLDSLRPVISTADIIQREIPVTIESWSEVDWFVQTSPIVEYRWNGFNCDSTSATTRIRYSGTFRPKKTDCVPFPGTVDPAWERLTDVLIYRDIYWRYVPPEKRTSGKSSWLVYPHNEVTVNGIRVQTLPGYEYDSLARLKLDNKLFGAGPSFNIRRPSLAIFDPAGVCPINLQRSSVAFDRMDIDLCLAKSVLKKNLHGLFEKAKKCPTISQFHKLCTETQTARDVIYLGHLSPLTATVDGFCLSSPKVLLDHEIRTIYFISVNSEFELPSTQLSDCLTDNEALIFRAAQQGRQSDLAWFRGAATASATADYYYSNEAGFPRLNNTSYVALMPKEKWTYVSERGRVSQYILNDLNQSSHSDSHVQVTAGEHKHVRHLANRCGELLQAMGKDAEVVCWSIAEKQPYAGLNSILSDMWMEVSQGRAVVGWTDALP